MLMIDKVASRVTGSKIVVLLFLMVPITVAGGALDAWFEVLRFEVFDFDLTCNGFGLERFEILGRFGAFEAAMVEAVAGLFEAGITKRRRRRWQTSPRTLI